MARLLSNIPVLAAGLPPILVHKERRTEYIGLLAAYQREAGALTPSSGVWPAGADPGALRTFFSSCHARTVEWVRDAHELQERRGRRQSREPGRSGHRDPHP